MARKRNDRSILLRANADRVAAITGVLGGEHQLLLIPVEVAFGPPEVGARGEVHDFLGGELGALRQRIQLRPVLTELVAAMLRGKDLPRRIDRNADGVAQASHEPLR